MTASVRYFAYLADLTDGDTDGPFKADTNAITSDLVMAMPGSRAGWTVDGGFAVQLTNKTGGASVKGELVEAAGGVNRAFAQAGADDVMPIGVVYEDGIGDGSLCWVVIYGLCQILLKDTTAGTRGNWVKTSDAAGRADATTAAPPGGGVAQLDEHMQEIGHCLETVGGGSDVLCWIMLHFN